MNFAHLKVGFRVVVNGKQDSLIIAKRSGEVIHVTDTGSMVLVRFDEKWSEHLHNGGGEVPREDSDRCFYLFDDFKGRITCRPSTHLNGLSGFPDFLENSLDPKPAFTVGSSSEMGKEPPMKYLTAYQHIDGEGYTPTGERFNSKRDADHHANHLASVDPGTTVVVFKAVSKHSSRVQVTSERM